MSGLPRELLKWVQSLDLTWQVKTPKWDLTNGYIIAEIFSWYYPQEIEMHMYNNGTSLDSKERNWFLLKNFLKKHKFEIPEEYIEGTIHCKEGAGHLLLERIYECLTNRQIKKQNPDENIDFTDRRYQEKLPLHARSTAAQSVKNNIRITELMADKNIILGQQKAHSIINQHVEYRKCERDENPERFNRKPTLGELAVRSAPPVTQRENTDMSGVLRVESEPSAVPAQKPSTHKQQGTISQGGRETSVHFKEVPVKQLDQHGQPFSHGQTIQGY